MKRDRCLSEEMRSSSAQARRPQPTGKEQRTLTPCAGPDPRRRSEHKRTNQAGAKGPAQGSGSQRQRFAPAERTDSRETAARRAAGALGQGKAGQAAAGPAPSAGKEQRPGAAYAVPPRSRKAVTRRDPPRRLISTRFCAHSRRGAGKSPFFSFYFAAGSR